LISKATLLTYRNRLDEAQLLLEGALARALAADMPAAAVRAFNNLAVNSESRDRYADALELSGRALELTRRVGDRVWEAIFLAGPLSAVVLLGRWDEALARAAETESLAGAEHAHTMLLQLVEIHCWRGQVADARARLDRHAGARSSDDTQIRTSFDLHEAMVLRTEGKPRAAIEALERVVAARDELGIRFLIVKLAIVESLESAFELGDTAKVAELLELVEGLRPGERPPLLDAHARRFRGRLTGDEAAFKAAAARFRELEMLFWLAVTELEHAESLAAQGRSDEAEELLREAREIFERLEATPWLDRARGGAGDEAEASVAY
jgi:tetratricopeptide (TPR) repeat protein